jgi:phage repressor protein C with HTH and peptisase S24 domain
MADAGGRYRGPPEGPSDDAVRFALRIRALIGRESLRAFALRAGISAAVLSQYMNAGSEPTRPILIAIANAGGCSVQWLALGDGEQGAPAKPAHIELALRLAFAIHQAGGIGAVASDDVPEHLVREVLTGRVPLVRPGGSSSGRDVVAAAAKAGRLPADWVAFGRGAAPEGFAAFLGPGTDADLPELFDRRAPAIPKRVDRAAPRALELLNQEYVVVPRYAVEAAAGAGVVVTDEQIVDYLAFRHDWVHRHGWAPNRLLVISAVGDSMEPTIADGDALLVNQGAPRLRDNAVYALVIGDALVVKRLERLVDGSVVIRCDNPRYREQVVAPGAVGDLRIVGQVVWAGGPL